MSNISRLKQCAAWSFGCSAPWHAALRSWCGCASQAQLLVTSAWLAAAPLVAPGRCVFKLILCGSCWTCCVLYVLCARVLGLGARAAPCSSAAHACIAERAAAASSRVLHFSMARLTISLGCQCRVCLTRLAEWWCYVVLLLPAARPALLKAQVARQDRVVQCRTVQ
jgi:hypothetical protein